MRLLGGLLSPFVMRAALAARMKGFDIPVEMPAGGLKSDGFLALNPLGRMPVLIDDDFVLPESAAIAEYLEEVLDGPGLLPGNAQERARARLLARVIDTYLIPALAPLFQPAPPPEAGAAARAAAGQALAALERLRPLHGEWLAGNDHSLADAAAMPVFFFLEAFDPVHATAALLDAHPGLKAWWQRAGTSEHGVRMMQEMTAALQAFMAGRA